DMNFDARPDIVTGSFSAGLLTTYINAGADEQDGPLGPAPPEEDFAAAAPPPNPPKFTKVYLGVGETFFRSPLRDETPGDDDIPGYSPDHAEPTFFSNSPGGNVIAIDVGRVDGDCPPDVAVIRADNSVVI